MKKAFIFLFFGLIISGIAFCGYKLFVIASDYRESRDIYADMNAQYLEALDEKETAFRMNNELTKPDQNIPFTVDFQSLAEVNQDIAGWIYIPGTEINYPVVKSKNNTDYLNHAADGRPAVAGAIFMDCNNDTDFQDKNTIIYGHNMKDGSMFHCLVKYADQEYFNEHDIVWIFTPGRVMKLRVIAAYQTTFDSCSYFTTFSDQSYADYLQDSLNKTSIQTHMKPDQSKPIITLSTCMKHGTPNRFVIILQYDAIYYEE